MVEDMWNDDQVKLISTLIILELHIFELIFLVRGKLLKVILAVGEEVKIRFNQNYIFIVTCQRCSNITRTRADLKEACFLSCFGLFFYGFNIFPTLV